MKKRSAKNAAGLFFLSALAVALPSCGGGKGGSNTGSAGASALPDLITATAIVDVNGDGKNDVIVGSQGGGYAAPILLINGGNGSSFTRNTTAIPQQYLGVNGSVTEIQTGDFNKDGKADLLVVATDARPTSFYATSQIQLFLGNGNGTFTDATANIASNLFPYAIAGAGCTSSGNWPEHLRVADIDGDGFLDFVTTSDGGGCGGIIYRNDGAGKFAPANITLTDGVNGGVYPVLAWNASVGGTVPGQTLGHSAIDVLAGDMNNDGKIDLFAPSMAQAPDHAAFINTSTPGKISFTIVYTQTKAVNPAGTDGFKNGVMLDINGDGFLDIVGSWSIAGFNSTVPVYAFPGTGTGGFTENNALLSPQPAVVHARQFLAADLNGDGKADLLIADHGWDAGTYPGARNWLMLNNGAGTLADKTASNLDLLPGYTHQAAIGDLNGDGKLDLILNNAACNGTTMTCANEPRFWLNNGAGAFASYSPAIQ